MRLRIVFIAVLMAFLVNAFAQTQQQLEGFNPITTAVPFLSIGPDARAGGLGDGGVASSPDANSMHWNPAKYVFAVDKQGFAINYTPWLRNLVNDINLAYLTYYNKIDRMNAIAFSLRYFTMGYITFTDENGNSLGDYKPNEFAIDATYSRRLSDYLSIAITGRFIYSNLTAGQYVQGVETTAGRSVATDIAMYWEKDVEWFNTMDAQFAWGWNISNIGVKISYNRSNIERDFIPANFRIGPRLTLGLDDYNKISFQLDINKLLVPTTPWYEYDSSGNKIPIPGTDEFEIAAGMNPDVPVIRGALQSWYDAPQGFQEELREYSIAFGTEYWYNDIFAVRAGYFYENRYKGNRQYATLGVGLRYNVFGLDFSYLIPTTGIENPLQNTLRFSLIFNFGKASTGEAKAPTG